MTTGVRSGGIGILVVLCSAVLRAESAASGVSTPARVVPSSPNLSGWDASRERVRAQVDQWMERLEAGRLEAFVIRFMDDTLFTHTGVLSQGRAWSIDAELPPAAERQCLVRDVLGPTRHERLVRASATRAAATRPPSEEGDLAVVLLGKTLAHAPLAALLRSEWELTPGKAKEADALRRHAAISIARLFLETDPSPRIPAANLLTEKALASRWKADLFTALYQTGNPQQRDEAIRLGASLDDARVWHALLETQRASTVSSEELRAAMLAWHGRMADEALRKEVLDELEGALYQRLASRLSAAWRRGLLSGGDRRALAVQCKRLLGSRHPDYRRSTISLLCAVGDDAEDGEFVASLLGDPLPEIRARVALALAEPFPVARARHLRGLADLLEDPDGQVRANALFALWREHEPDKAYNLLSTPEVFNQQKAATLAWLKRNRGIEPKKP